jgi:enediyne biosynthesis protein E4
LRAIVLAIGGVTDGNGKLMKNGFKTKLAHCPHPRSMVTSCLHRLRWQHPNVNRVSATRSMMAKSISLAMNPRFETWCLIVRCVFQSVNGRYSSSPKKQLNRSRLFAWCVILIQTLGFCDLLSSQSPATINAGPPADSAQTSGMAAGPVQKAEFDAEHRPITSGGLVKSGPVVFQEVAEQAGLAHWRNVTGTPQKRVIVEAKGSGVCLLDYDNDGWLDIYLVSGSTFDALAGKASPPHAALFHNNHDGTFTDVTEKAGVANDRWGLGCAVGDYDNDGWPDLYVTNLGKARLYHNNHDGTFTDVAEKAGVALNGETGSIVTDYTGATFGDYDGDGRLDLFVAGYIRYDFANPPVPGSKTVHSPTCQYRAVDVMCGPRGLPGAGDHLFHNNGDGTFTDVSVKAGVSDPNGFYGLGALFVDVNGDGKPDLVVANDSTPNYLYMNKGDGTFDDQSYVSGYALNKDGREASNMGIAAGDYENNGHLDLVNTEFSDDYDIVFHNDGTANFEDVSYHVGVAGPTIPFVGFGDGFLDYDNDGWKDLLIVNGHVYPGVDNHPEWGMSYAQRSLLFHNLRNGTFELVAAVEGTGLAKAGVGRGAAFGDLFNDGKIDVVIDNLDGAPFLLRNVNPDHNHWVELKLVGGRGSPRDAVGATVYLTAGGIRQRGDVLSGGSYLSSNDLRVHFGLGGSARVDELEIQWPSGQVEKVKPPAIDRIFTIEQGRGIQDELCTACGTEKNQP